MPTLTSEAQNLLNTQNDPLATSFVNSRIGGSAGTFNASDVSSFLSQYKPKPQQVFSPQNVQQTLTQPVEQPNYADPFALRDYFFNTPDVTVARGDVQKLTNQLNSFDTGTNNQMNFLEDQTLAMPVIAGQQASQQRLRSTGREAIARDLMARQQYLDSAMQEANAKYQIAQQQRSQIQELIAQTGGRAKISYTDSYESAVKKASKYLDKQAKKMSKSSGGSSGKRLSASGKKLSKKEYAKYTSKSSSSQKKSSGSGSSKKSSKSSQADITRFYSDAERLRKSMTKGNADWSYSWGLLSNKYPEASTELIDQTLGFDYRRQYDK